MGPTRRFSSRVENYVRYRPGYPAGVLDLLQERYGLTSSSEIADVGSGTGALARIFLENGNRVFGVEPNAQMRLAGERLLAEFPGFTSVAATAEGRSTAPHTCVCRWGSPGRRGHADQLSCAIRGWPMQRPHARATARWHTAGRWPLRSAARVARWCPPQGWRPCRWRRHQWRLRCG